MRDVIAFEGDFFLSLFSFSEKSLENIHLCLASRRFDREAPELFALGIGAEIILRELDDLGLGSDLRILDFSLLLGKSGEDNRVCEFMWEEDSHISID